jgi:dGTPase
LRNACLVHDIGNPPFGHFGETAIQNYFTRFFNENRHSLRLESEEQEDFKLFDGNAQGFRLLTKLQALEDQYGLNLTFATLSSYLKYPNAGPIDKGILARKKRGVFQSEKAYLKEIAENCNLIKGEEIIRHPLVFLVEAADSICYLVMDIEDGFNKGWYDYDYVKAALTNINGTNSFLSRIEAQYKTDVGRIVSLRINLISQLVDLAFNNFVKYLDLICHGNYNKELIFDDVKSLAKTLKEFCVKNVYTNKEIEFLELTGDSVLSGLLDYYIQFLFHKDEAYKKRAIGLISNSIKKAALIENNLCLDDNFDKLSDYYKLRVIVDFVSGMTDQYALNHYRRLNGQKII